MLYAIQAIHDAGYIHRDVKPSNFVLGSGKGYNQVYLIDFGLGKRHLNEDGTPVEERKNMSFRGTVAYASLNAHNKLVNLMKNSRICRDGMIYGVGILYY